MATSVAIAIDPVVNQCETSLGHGRVRARGRVDGLYGDAMPLGVHLAERLLAAAALWLAAPAAFAVDWSATSLSGAVLSLVGDQWSEVEKDAVFGHYGALRTLQGGKLTLVAGNALLIVAPGTAFELLTEPHTSGTLIRQYSGTLAIESDASVADIWLETASLHIAPLGGSVTVTVTESVTEVAVRGGGSASVTDVATGASVTVESGHALTSAPSGNAVAAFDPGEGEVSYGPAASEQEPTSSTGASSSNGVGQGNGGGSNASGSSEGGNGNAGGSNSGGNGSNSGGNQGGSDNAHESGNGNASGNANGNAGGNASGNAGANGNGNGNNGSQ